MSGSPSLSSSLQSSGEWALTPDQSPTADSRLKRRSLWLTLLCCWMLMLVTFSVPGRDQQVLGTLDIVGFAKVIARATSLAILVTLLPQLASLPNRRFVISCLVPLILFVGFAILSSLWSPLVSVSVGQSGSLTVQVMITLALGLLCTTTRDVSTVLFSISTVLLLIVSVLLLARVLVPSLGSISRDGAGVFHATSAGASASLGIILLVASRTLWNWPWSRIMVLTIPLHLIVLILAVNRVSLALTLCLVFYLTLWTSHRTVALACFVAFSLCATVYLMIDPNLEIPRALMGSAATYANRGQTVEDIKELSGRGEMWTAIWNAYQESIFVGHGYAVCSPTGKLYVWFEYSNWTAHNVVLQCLMSTGLVGLILLLWGFVRIGRRCLKMRIRGQLSKEFGIFLTIMFFWNFVWGMFNSSFLGPVTPESVIFYVVMGLAVGQLCGSLPSRPTVRLTHPFAVNQPWAGPIHG